MGPPAARPQRGVLYAGLMITDKGPKLIVWCCLEFSSTMSALRRSEETPGADASPALGPPAGPDRLAADGMLLAPSPCAGRDEAALCVVMEARAIRENPVQRARGLSKAWACLLAHIDDVVIFHAGTKPQQRRPDPRQWRPRAQRLRRRARPCAKRSSRAYAGGRPHQMAGRFLPPRHRLAGGGAGADEG